MKLIQNDPSTKKALRIANTAIADNKEDITTLSKATLEMAKEIQELKALLGNQSDKAQPLANTATEKDDKDAQIAALKQALTLVNKNKGGRRDTNPKQPKKPRNDQPDKGWGPERSQSRYPGICEWCWSCGHNLQPGHTSKNCQYPKEGHQREATLSNQMGGSQRNKHLCVNCP